MAKLRPYKVTLLTLIIGVPFTFALSLNNVNLLAQLQHYFQRLEALEAGEWLLLMFVLLIAIIIDLLVLRHERLKQLEIERQRLQVLKATMTSVQDIVGNFLTNVQLFQIEAENKGLLSSDSQQLFDSLIFDTSDKLTRLANLESTPERKMATGIYGIDYENLTIEEREEHVEDILMRR